MRSNVLILRSNVLILRSNIIPQVNINAIQYYNNTI